MIAKILLLQREVPDFVNVVAARTANKAETLVILDVGGRDEPISEELLQNIDIISPNEVISFRQIFYIDRARESNWKEGNKC